MKKDQFRRLLDIFEDITKDSDNLCEVLKEFEEIQEIINLPDDIWCVVESYLLEKAIKDEDAPTNVTGSAISTNEPVGRPKTPMQRRKWSKMPKFQNAPIFEVDSKMMYSIRSAKKPGAKWSQYFDDKISPGSDMKAYARSNPGQPIIIRCDKTGAMQYFKH